MFCFLYLLLILTLLLLSIYITPNLGLIGFCRSSMPFCCSDLFPNVVLWLSDRYHDVLPLAFQTHTALGNYFFCPPSVVVAKVGDGHFSDRPISLLTIFSSLPRVFACLRITKQTFTPPMQPSGHMYLGSCIVRLFRISLGPPDSPFPNNYFSSPSGRACFCIFLGLRLCVFRPLFSHYKCPFAGLPLALFLIVILEPSLVPPPPLLSKLL